MDRGLSGRNPLAYMGVEPSTPPNLVINKQDPTVNDGFNYALGTYWLTVPQMQTKTATGLFVLISLANNSANWEQIWPVGANDLTFITDDGQTSPSNQGDLNLNGTGTMVLVHSAANNTIELLPNYPNPAGDPGNDGMVFIGGQSGGQWAQLTQGAGITIANGDGVISISSGGGGGGITEVHTDTADVPPAMDGSITLVGDGTLITVDGDTLSSTATITQVTNPTISGNVTFTGNVTFNGTTTGGTFNTIVTTYNTPGAHTWNKNANTKYVEVVAWGGGSGGGSGALKGPSSNGGGGGGGGAGGGWFWYHTLASFLDNSVNIVVGSGGAGGAGSTGSASVGGNAGSPGGESSFGTMKTSLTGSGGNTYGSGGLNDGAGTPGNGGFSPLGLNTYALSAYVGSVGGIAGAGGPGNSGAATGVAGTDTSGYPLAPTGGGGGAGAKNNNSAPATAAGGRGGNVLAPISGTILVAGGTAGNPGDGGAGGAVIANSGFICGGAGGGGGGMSSTPAPGTQSYVIGANGGNGSQPGGGGGGGAGGKWYAGHTGTSGNGGNGGDGMVIVIEYL